MFCVKCGSEVPNGHRFCGYCGATVEVLPPERVATVTKGDVGVDRSTTSISQVTHTDENSAKVGGSINISVGGDRGGLAGLVICPWCGAKNEPRDTFLCLQCKRDHLCRDHHDRTKFVCKACAGSVEAAEPVRSSVEAGPSERIVGPHGMEFVLIPGGEFLMGSPEDEECLEIDENQHRVRITKPFYMQTTPVTQRQWKAVMGNRPSKFKGDDRPVESVSWDDVQEFLGKLNARAGTKYRLPTEAEWEYACRAGTTAPFCFGETITTAQANFDGSFCGGDGGTREETTPVKSFPPNAWGLYDMHGNVWEWCSDWYASDYYKDSPPNDPKGPASGKSCVLRGGSWDSPAQRASSRKHAPSCFRYSDHGFRCVRGLS